jgi:hypothetical protein
VSDDERDEASMSLGEILREAAKDAVKHFEKEGVPSDDPRLVKFARSVNVLCVFADAVSDKIVDDAIVIIRTPRNGMSLAVTDPDDVVLHMGMLESAQVIVRSNLIDHYINHTKDAKSGDTE